jgi:hypothetical protein
MKCFIKSTIIVALVSLCMHMQLVSHQDCSAKRFHVRIVVGHVTPTWYILCNAVKLHSL